MPVYKIRRSDGKYSSGGSTPRFTKSGKAWTTEGNLNSHITQVHDAWLRQIQSRPSGENYYPYTNCVVEVYNLVDTRPIDIKGHIERRLAEIRSSFEQCRAAGRPLYEFDIWRKQALDTARDILGIPR